MGAHDVALHATCGAFAAFVGTQPLTVTTCNALALMCRLSRCHDDRPAGHDQDAAPDDPCAPVVLADCCLPEIGVGFVARIAGPPAQFPAVLGAGHIRLRSHQALGQQRPGMLTRASRVRALNCIKNYYAGGRGVPGGIDVSASVSAGRRPYCSVVVSSRPRSAREHWAPARTPAVYRARSTARTAVAHSSCHKTAHECPFRHRYIRAARPRSRTTSRRRSGAVARM